MKLLLNVGCGPSIAIPAAFASSGWQQIRLDIDPQVAPDIVASITSIPMRDQSVDAVYSSHNLEHLYSHEVPAALQEFFRVLRPGGLIYIAVPDAQAVAKAIADNDLDAILYQSPAGPISGADTLWGHRGYIASGNAFYQHKTGFSKTTLRKLMEREGFDVVLIHNQSQWDMIALARKAD